MSNNNVKAGANNNPALLTDSKFDSAPGAQPSPSVPVVIVEAPLHEPHLEHPLPCCKCPAKKDEAFKDTESRRKLLNGVFLLGACSNIRYLEIDVFITLREINK